MSDTRPAWVQCGMCEDFMCNIHDKHVADCDCPGIDEWGDVWPYDEGSMLLPPGTESEKS